MEYLVQREDNNYEIDINLRKKLIEFEKRKIEIEVLKEKLKEELKEVFENVDGCNIVDDVISIKYSKPSQRTTIDSTRLKKELPDIYEEYAKTTQVSSSITMKYDL